jgi:hypothetical protein
MSDHKSSSIAIEVSKIIKINCFQQIILQLCFARFLMYLNVNPYCWHIFIIYDKKERRDVKKNSLPAVFITAQTSTSTAGIRNGNLKPIASHVIRFSNS